MYIIIGISIFLLFAMVILPEVIRHRRNMVDVVDDEEIPLLQEIADETNLLQSNEIPTDEHILLYYKMYLKKWELDHKELTLPDSVKPMQFDEWEKIAKTMDEYGGYNFIISNTMDVFISMNGRCGSMMRCNDYRKMVDDDEKQNKEQEK
jgi:hypothetical protein